MIDVRPIRVEDEAAWRTLWRGYLDFYRKPLPEEVYRTTFRRLVDDGAPDQRGLLACRDAAPIGLAHVIYHRHGWQIADVCYLQDLFVAPEARRAGVGRALIEAVFAAADANGTPDVYWLTDEANASARKLYDRIGTRTGFIKYRR